MNVINIKLKSVMENIAISRNIIGVIIVDKNPTMSFINEVKTIVSEAVTNSIIHGYENDESKEILLDIILNEENVEITITDYGNGIENIEQARQPMFSTKPQDDRSGLGFTIMEIFADELIIDSKKGQGTIVKIIKNFN